MAQRLTRDQRKARTRTELISAAARVFARKGYNAASVDDVAAEAGFTKGAFYSNFESKDDVFIALVEDRSQSWTMAVARAYDGPGPLADRLRQGGEFLTRMLREEADWILLSNEMWTQSIRNPDLRGRLAECYEECRSLLARVIQDVEDDFGVELPMTSHQIAALTMALTDGFVLQQLVDPERIPASLLADGLNLFFSGLIQGAAPQPKA